METKTEEQIELNNQDAKSRKTTLDLGQNDQTQWIPIFNEIPPKLRAFPTAPGWFPPFLDMMIFNIIQTVLLLTNIMVILSSFTLQRDDKFYIILAEIVFTYLGFGLYVRFIRANELMYKNCFKFFDKLSDCACGIFWWILAAILFPFMQIYCLILAAKEWYRSKQHTPQNLDLKNIKDAKLYWKMADDAYNVLDICVLCKLASIFVIFIQEIPLFVICCVISNEFAAVIYIIAIMFKIACWIKHNYDIGKCSIINENHYFPHFGIKSVSVCPQPGTGFWRTVHPFFYTEDESQRIRWEERDPVYVYDGETQQWQTMIIVVIDKNDVIKVSEIGVLQVQTAEELQQYLNEKGIYKFDRWEESIKPLTDDQWIEFIESNAQTTVNQVFEVAEPVTGCTEVESNKITNGNVTEVTNNIDTQSEMVNMDINTNEIQNNEEMTNNTKYSPVQTTDVEIEVLNEHQQNDNEEQNDTQI